MSDAYVFDTEAIIAFLYDEPGHDRVGDLLDEVEAGDAEGLLSETNASEVYYLVARSAARSDAGVGFSSGVPSYRATR